MEKSLQNVRSKKLGQKKLTLFLEEHSMKWAQARSTGLYSNKIIKYLILFFLHDNYEARVYKFYF